MPSTCSSISGSGHKDNRGVLLLLAPNDHRYRVEVGYGLEPVINDARAGDVGRAMLPALKRGDYSGAIDLGVNQLASIISAASNVKLQTGTVPVGPVRRTQPQSSFPWWILLLGIPAVPFVLRAMRSSTVADPKARGRGPGIFWVGPGGGWGGGGFGGGGFGGSSGGFGGFGGGESGGGGASGSW